MNDTSHRPSGPEPSDYEKQAWEDLTTHRSRRPVTLLAQHTAGLFSDAAGKIAENEWVKGLTMKAREVGSGLGGRTPESLKKAGARAGHYGSVALKQVGEGATRLATRLGSGSVSRRHIVKAHQKRGHPVELLHDIRTLDLELVDKVRPARADILHSAVAAAVGAGSGVVVTGGWGVVVTPGGQAPGVGITTGAIASDLALVTTISGRIISLTAAHYGYDPNRPEEMVYAAGISNLGTALTSASKAVAYDDLIQLTQMLGRNATWERLYSRFTARAADLVTRRMKDQALKRGLTKAGLSKALPLIAIVTGASLNWLTLEQIGDAADTAYRRRFLLDKYPHLAGTAQDPFAEQNQEPADEVLDAEVIDEPVSVVQMLEEAPRHEGQVD